MIIIKAVWFFKNLIYRKYSSILAIKFENNRQRFKFCRVSVKDVAKEIKKLSLKKALYYACVQEMLYRLRAITAEQLQLCKQIILLIEQLSSKYQCGFFIAFSVQHCLLRAPSHERTIAN